MSLASYERVISDSLCNELLEYFNSIKHRLIHMSASPKFPPRKHDRNIPEYLVEKIKQNVHDNIGKKYQNMAIKDNIRIYLSNFGTVKPHVDVSMYGDDTHTCLIYLTDDFIGGVLTVEDENQKNIHLVQKNHME